MLDSLVYVCEHFGKLKSAETLKAGLAYDEKGMGPELFCEAAERVGLNASIVRKESLMQIAKPVLPCVLFLNDNNAAVLLEMDRDAGEAKLYIPESDSVKNAALSEIEQSYTGYAIFVHPRAEFNQNYDERTGNIPGHWFWGIIKQNRSIYMMVLLASLFINLFALVSPMFVMTVYDRVIPNNAIETGWALGIGALVAFFFDFVFRSIRGYLIDFAGRKTDILAARRIFNHVLDMRLVDRPSSSGSFANVLGSFDTVREFFTSATITAIVDLPFTILFMFFVYQLGGGIAFILCILIMIVIATGFILQASLKNLVHQSMQASQTRHGLLVEVIAGLETIKANHADGRFRSRYGAHIAEDAAYAQKSRLLSSLGVNIATLAQQSASVFIILAGMYLVQDSEMSVGALIACVILGGRAIAPVGQVANLITKYHLADRALGLLNDIMDKEPETDTMREFLHRPNLSGDIKFDKVSFEYETTQVKVLDNISFSIKAGERVGIIGRVGSGKSTIAKLLLKLYEPSEGTILVDSTDYRQIDPADLRKNMAYVSQDVTLFQGTVRENITASKPNASEDEILSCAKSAGVHDFISRHPMGYDALVGERGSYLSGGQRQAVALARAMLTKPNIMLFDEPTSAMDSQSENRFCEFIQSQTEGQTLLLVTHKNSMLQMVDRLILVHDGKVIMDDARDKVLTALQTGEIQVKGGAQ